MPKKINLEKQREALQNSLNYFKFPEKFFIHVTAPKFIIASKNETGGINTHSNFMTYEEMNCFIFGYNLALTNPLK